MKLLLENWRGYIKEIIGDPSKNPRWSPHKAGDETYEYEDDEDENELTPDQIEFPERYGNCGMLALALIGEGIKRKIKGIEIVFMTADKGKDFLKAEEPEIHHVAMWFNEKYYDDRGEVTRDQLGIYSPLELTSLDYPAEEGRDYIVLAYKIKNNEDLKLATDIVKNNTGWWKSCEEYIQRAEDFWENIK